MVSTLQVESPTATHPDVLLSLKARYQLPCTYHFYSDPPHIVGGSGCILTDSNGAEYIDCLSGVAAMNAGHCNPEIIEPAIEQIRRLQHTTSIYLTEPVLRLAEALAELAPGNLTRSFFCASGSEATEGAMMLACRATHRPNIVSMTGGLHGRTRWGVNATGIPMWQCDPFPLESVFQVPFGDIDSLHNTLRENAGTIAAVIAEPIQGNGGIGTATRAYWQAVEAVCREHNVLLILDEIQTGFNRTGTWFACEHYGITPDILCLSKALGNGFPIAAFMSTDDLANSFKTPSASTYGGNPVCATAALATIAYHDQHDLGTAARAQGQHLLEGLRQLHGTFPECTRPPRGLGLMLGIPIVNAAGEPDAERTDAVLETMKDNGILAGKTGLHRNVLTFMPPLTISESQISEVTRKCYAALSESMILGTN